MVKMMSHKHKSDAIVLSEATEIMDSLPVAMRHDEQIMDCVIESLQSGISKHEARIDALEIAQLKTQEAMAKGFQLVNGELTNIKHEVALDRVHATYAKEAAQQSRAIAERAWEKVQEVAIGVAKAEAKADGARDLAKRSNRFEFDPLTGMALCAIAMIGALFLMSVRVERVPEKQNSLNDALKEFCENPNNSCTDGKARQPIPTSNRGGV
jgi:hypothetical protein